MIAKAKCILFAYILQTIDIEVIIASCYVKK